MVSIKIFKNTGGQLMSTLFPMQLLTLTGQTLLTEFLGQEKSAILLSADKSANLFILDNQLNNIGKLCIEHPFEIRKVRTGC